MKELIKEDLLEAIELADDDGQYYYNKVSGEIIYVNYDDMRLAEEFAEDEIDDYPQCQKEALEAAIDVEENWDNYIPLLSKFDIDEYNIMTEFCYTLANNTTCNKLLSALNGSGAFRRFKDAIIRLNVEKKWYDFRDEAFLKIALEWCEENGVIIKETNNKDGREF